ncbi:MAG: hypothetical protein WKG06_37975 [Segetibacter sp.]
MLSDIKNEVLTLVQSIENEDLLQLLKADIEFFNKPGVDITDDLSAEDLDELRELANERDTKDSLSEEEFKQLTDRWRTK